MTAYFKPLFRAALLILALQPLYLIALVATDYIARPELRRMRMQGAPPTPDKATEDCVGLGIGLEPGGKGFRNAIMAARPLSAGYPCDALVDALANDPKVTWFPYPRYWHGYRLVMDPLTAWFQPLTVRYIMMAGLIIALTWFAFELRSRFGADASIGLIVPTVVLTDFWTAWNYGVHTIPIVVIFAGSALFLRKLARPDSNLILIAAVCGSFFNYVDFLINVPWQPMLIAFVALASGRRITEALVFVVAWFGGYSLTWASKWAIACAAGVPWSEILDVIKFRLNGDIPGNPGYILHDFLAPTTKVLTYLFNQTQSAIVFLVLLPTLLLPVRRFNLGRFAVLSLPILIPLAWFETLSNHTQIHAWITYRTIASCIGILIAAAIIASRERSAAMQQKSAG